MRAAVRGTRGWLLRGWLIGLGLLAACGPAADRLEPVHHFADASRPGAHVEVGGRLRAVLPGNPFAPPRLREAGDPWVVEEAPATFPQERRAWLEAALVEIPEGAVLAFGIGLRGQGSTTRGPVVFSVAACAGDACAPLFRETLAPDDAATWRDRRIDLSDRAGPLRLRFEVEHVRADAGAQAFPVWANPVLLAPPPSAAGPSLLLVSIDTLRADHLGTYGYPRETDPFLRAFFAGGAVFEHCVSSATSTGPAHMTMFTSLDPRVHGVIPTPEFGRTLPEGVVTLASALRRAGFATAAFTENGPLIPARGFARGFDAYEETISGARGGTPGHAVETFAKARAWLDRHADRRFFLFVHTYEVHAPYEPPAETADLFRDGPGARAGPGFPPHLDPVLYDREIRHTDAQLRGLVEALEARGRLGDTLVVVTSDHGEAFLEHGFFGHGPDLHEEVLRVPLLLRGPGVPAGVRVAAPVGLVDLMPTLLDLLGVPPVLGAMGRSAAPLLRGESVEAFETRPLHSGAWVTRALVTGGQLVEVPQPSHAVRVGSRKLIRRATGAGVRERVYDLASDPAEQLAAEDDGTLGSLLEAHDAEVVRRRAALLGAGDEPPERALDEARRERLRALGYIE